MSSVKKFNAQIELLGINPFVSVPQIILQHIFIQAGKNKGFIPIKGTVNGKTYLQTLVKYRGDWRLYINNSMLKHSPKRIGENIEVTIQFDPVSRDIKMPISFKKALEREPGAKKVFLGLSPSRKKEIVRYLANLKSEETLNKNIKRAINFLKGEAEFVGRKKP